jgi:hypothetical protein
LATIIIIGYPCIGKSTVASSHKGFIDLESSFFSKRIDDWAIDYCNDYCKLAFKLAEDGNVVFVSSHSDVVKTLKELRVTYSLIEIVIICPLEYLHDDWIDRAELRYEISKSDKDKRALYRIKTHYNADIHALEDSGFPVYHIDEKRKLSDFIVDVFD